MRRKNKRWIAGILPAFFHSCLIFIVFIFGCFIFAPPDAAAQEPTSAENESEWQDSDDFPKLHISVKVNLVMHYASVTDKNNHFVSGLEQSRFRVFEDDAAQKIEFFAQEDVPVSMGIVLDLSASMKGKIDQVKQAALALLHASNPGDEYFLIGFNREVELLHDYTGNIDEIGEALENVVVVGKTHLYDAVYLGVEKAQAGAKSKKAIVVITDGNDDTSYYSLKELIDKIQTSDVQVFCVGLLDDPPRKSIFGRWSYSGAKKYYDALVKISEETGGNAFFPRNTYEIREIVDEIARDLRGQYSIGYFSSNTAGYGTYRRIKIELTGKNTGGLTIRHRRGYYAP